MVAPVDLTGRRFGKLVALHPVATKTRWGKRKWLCVCDCGNRKEVVGTNLSTGNTQSCGCVGRSRLSERQRTHGLSSHPLYSTWKAMRSRCYNPNNKAYANYGGRGITMCNAWRESFVTFLRDMGDRPQGTSLERVDNARGYYPDNCTWATPKQQANNRRAKRIYDTTKLLSPEKHIVLIKPGAISAFCREHPELTRNDVWALRHGKKYNIGGWKLG